MPSQAEKAETFRALHEGPEAFVIPNPWDAGTARLLAHLGFQALATTSAGLAFSLGRPDSEAGRERTLDNARAIVDASDLPVSADLEGGFGDGPETVAETIRLAAGAGLVGGSIEDATGRPDDPIYPRELAADRVRAAVEAARSLPFRFTVTGRAENFLFGRRDLGDTIARLQAYQEAGADVLYAPGLGSRDEITTVVRAVDRPVNVLMGPSRPGLSVADLSAIGVRRISVGSALALTALGAFLRASREMLDHGTFGFGGGGASYADINRIFADWPGDTDRAD